MPTERSLMVAEPAVLYVSSPTISTFPIARFDTLGQRLSFTQQEWASILHISDRTLQRYLKSEQPFEGLHAEHLHQLEALTALGLDVFSDTRSFDGWLRRDKHIMGKDVGFDALRSFGGTQLLSDELGRIAHGVYI